MSSVSNDKVMPRLVSVITPFPYHIRSTASLQDAHDLMDKHEVRHLIVTREGDLYGVIALRDMHRHSVLYSKDDEEGLTVGDLCSEQIVCADINDPLDKVLDAMASQHLSCVVVLREGELAGVFTATDVCQNFSRFLKDHYTVPDAPDDAA